MKKIIRKTSHFIKKFYSKTDKTTLFIGIAVIAVGVIFIAGTFLKQPLSLALASVQNGITSLTEKKQASYLQYEKKVFARVTEKEGVIFLDKAVYQRGEPVHFALVKVGPFKKDAEGKNWVDMDILVKDPDGNIAMKKEHLLGNGGHLKLENDTAPSPDGVYVPGMKVKLGKYFVSIRVYDRIGLGEVSDSGTFEIIRENPNNKPEANPTIKAPAAANGNTLPDTKK